MTGAIIFQSLFTSVFGMYACYSYIITKTLMAPIILHILCNTLQFPSFYYLQRKDLSQKFKNCKIILIKIFSYINSLYFRHSSFYIN